MRVTKAQAQANREHIVETASVLFRERGFDGVGVADRIQQISGGTFVVRPGSLFPALHRLEQDGSIKGEWSQTPEGRRAKYYRITAAGQRQLSTEKKNWARIVLAIGLILEAD